jgi:GDP-D-mannose 3',5'-epimerase
MKVCVTGVAGFVGSHLAKRLRSLGYHVVGTDWKRPDPECIQIEESCDEFVLEDLRTYAACVRATRGCRRVYHLAADMGGMGFIQSNHSLCVLNNALIDLHVIEACRANGVERVFYSSSACVYPEHLQMSESALGLAETDAWPAKPQDAYGLEKLFAESAYERYAADFGMDVRVARFHNVYGPRGTWRGGREKAPAAMCRKVAAAEDGGSVEIWGDGKQTRSFVFVDDIVDGIVRLTDSDVSTPMNIGTEELVSVDELADVVADISGKVLVKRHVPGPEGVRGRNSDNTLMRLKLGWEPPTKLRDGLEKTYAWVSSMVEKNSAELEDLRSSVVVRQEMVPLS